MKLAAVVGVPGEDGAGAVELLEQHDAHELMRPGCCTECEPECGAWRKARREAVGAADNEGSCRAVIRPPALQLRGETGAVEIFAALIENDDHPLLGEDVGERDRFLGTAPLGVMRAALANFDDLDRAQAQRPSGIFGALAIRRGKLALGTLLQAAD